MGNHHSQTLELNPDPTWSHSFPREKQKKLLKCGAIQEATSARKVSKPSLTVKGKWSDRETVVTTAPLRLKETVSTLTNALFMGAGGEVMTGYSEDV